MASVRRAQESDPDYPRVLFFHLGTPEEGDDFLAKNWPEARAISDPDAVFYEAFGIGKGTLRQYLGLSAIRAGFSALLKGHGVGKPVGDPTRMSGAIAIRDQRVIWTHTYRHSGDHPDFENLREALSA